jgi:hypothetical protein
MKNPTLYVNCVRKLASQSHMDIVVELVTLCKWTLGVYASRSLSVTNTYSSTTYILLYSSVIITVSYWSDFFCVHVYHIYLLLWIGSSFKLQDKSVVTINTLPKIDLLVITNRFLHFKLVLQQKISLQLKVICHLSAKFISQFKR